MRRLIFILLVLVLAACREETAQPEVKISPAAPRLRVIVSEARVFTHPSRDAEVLFRLIEGDEVPVFARTEADLIGVTWYQVGQGDQFGWIAGSQVEVIGEISLLRVVAFDQNTPPPIVLSPTPVLTLTATTSPLDDPILRVSVPVAAVFLNPQRESAEVTRLVQGETADILGKTEAQDDVFYLIGRSGTVLGWILESQVAAEGNLADVPIFSLDEALAAVLPTQALVLQPSLAPSVEPSRTPTSIPSDTVEPTATQRLQSPSPSPNLAGTAQAAPTATDIPQTMAVETAAVEASATPEPQIERGVPPPFRITLPPGWGEAHVFVPISSEYLQGTLPVSLYQGQLEGDTFGFIWVVWSFPTLVDLGSGELSLYADGLQLLRGVVFDSAACTISLGSERRQQKVGEYDGVGTIYSVTDCPDSNDTAGFFVVLSVEGENFAFFTGVEPLTATDSGLPQIQAILDSIQFEIQDTSD